MIRAKCGRSREVGSIFQFTPPRGGRPMPAFCCVILRLHFNSRPRVGGDLSTKAAISQKSPFQFTPPRGGRPGLQQKGLDKLLISIHAPAWGATMPLAQNIQQELFQFTPPRGGRPVQLHKPHNAGFYFNSRPRVGGDDADAGEVQIIDISIHAPAWGATPSGRRCSRRR